MDPITLHPRVGAAVLALVKRFEGFRATATPLPGGGVVIGYGHVLARDPGRALSPAEGDALLRYDLSRDAREIEPLILAPVSAAQFDTLLSFAFGVGVAAFARSPVLKRLNAGAYLDAAAALELWRVAELDGEPVVLDALVRRRAVEKAAFLAPPGDFQPTPSALLRPLQDEAALRAAEAMTEPRPRAALVDSDENGVALRRASLQAGEPAPSLLLGALAALAGRSQGPRTAEPPPPPDSEVVAAPPHVSWPSARGPAILMGVVGLLVFALAVVRIYKAPSLGDLALGVLGVVAMTPAAMWLATLRPTRGSTLGRRDDG